MHCATYDVEWELRQFIAEQDDTPFVEVEKIVSGQGIYNTYRFLAHQNPSAIDVELDQRIRQSKEPAAIIAQNAAQSSDETQQSPNPNPNPLCVEAVDMFVRALGRECGTLALRFQPRAGCYVAGGGIAAKMTEQLCDG